MKQTFLSLWIILSVFSILSCKKAIPNAEENLGASHARAVVPPPLAYTQGDYQSSRPYNLEVLYIVPSDKDTLQGYQQRLSAILLKGQEFYRSEMTRNGFANKTFGLWTSKTDASQVQIITVTGAKTNAEYNANPDLVQADVNQYYTDHPSSSPSTTHTLIIMPKYLDTDKRAFYGLAPKCYAVDYLDFDVVHAGEAGAGGIKFAKYYGGLMHELGHGLNLPHTHETASEHTLLGTNLMGTGNTTLSLTPTFINLAGCVILDNCPVFANATGGTYYNSYTATLQSLSGKLENDTLYVSGTFSSTLPVSAVNVIQDDDARSDTYYAVAWSVKPTQNNFSVKMAVSDLDITASPDFRQGNFHLLVQLALTNGNRKTITAAAYSFVNELPVLPATFNFINPGNYQIATALNTSNVLNVRYGYTADGTPVELHPGTTNSQRWNFESLGSGIFRLHPLNVPSSASSMEANAGGTADGTTVVIRANANVSQQKWTISPTTDGYYILTPGNATGKAMDLSGGSSADRTPLVINSLSGGKSQKWRIIPII